MVPRVPPRAAGFQRRPDAGSGLTRHGTARWSVSRDPTSTSTSRFYDPCSCHTRRADRRRPRVAAWSLPRPARPAAVRYATSHDPVQHDRAWRRCAASAAVFAVPPPAGGAVAGDRGVQPSTARTVLPTCRDCPGAAHRRPTAEHGEPAGEHAVDQVGPPRTSGSDAPGDVRRSHGADVPRRTRRRGRPTPNRMWATRIGSRAARPSGQTGIRRRRGGPGPGRRVARRGQDTARRRRGGRDAARPPPSVRRSGEAVVTLRCCSPCVRPPTRVPCDDRGVPADPGSAVAQPRRPGRAAARRAVPCADRRRRHGDRGRRRSRRGVHATTLAVAGLRPRVALPARAARGRGWSTLMLVAAIGPPLR